MTDKQPDISPEAVELTAQWLEEPEAVIGVFAVEDQECVKPLAEVAAKLRALSEALIFMEQDRDRWHRNYEWARGALGGGMSWAAEEARAQALKKAADRCGESAMAAYAGDAEAVAEALSKEAEYFKALAAQARQPEQEKE